jgi:hypothetical protein
MGMPPRKPLPAIANAQAGRAGLCGLAFRKKSLLMHRKKPFKENNERIRVKN